MGPCPFCDYSGPNEVRVEQSGIIIIEPLHPVVPGHELVIPRKHVESAMENPTLTGDVMRIASMRAGMWRSSNIITSIGEAATQTVRHLHVHIVPRRKGDGLMLPWPTGSLRYTPEKPGSAEETRS